MVDERQILTRLADGCFHSGQDLADNLGISRTGVWKCLQQLQQTLGIELYAVSGKGYKLARPLQLLDPGKLRQLLSQEITPDVLPVLEVFLTLDSTNRYGLEQARRLPHQPRLVLAEAQTAGRGRRGRQWVSPFGTNLYLSLYWWFDEMPEVLGTLSLVVASVLARCLESVGVLHCEVKWPNDICFQGKKLAGILLEMQGEAGGGCGVVIGIGINLDMHGKQVETIDQPWTDVNNITGKRVDRNALVVQLVTALVNVLQQHSAESLIPYLDEWRRRDMLYNQQVSLHQPNDNIVGTARGIDPQGALLIEQDGEIRRFFSGEVSVRLAESNT